MITASLHSNNRLIRQSLIQAVPVCFAVTMTASIVLMVDSMLAGRLISQLAIASVAIGTPVINIFQALVQTVVAGASVQLAVLAGRGDRKAMNQTYTLGLISVVVLGAISALICFIFAEPLVMLFGGAGSPEAAPQAIIYLRASLLALLFPPVNMYLGKILSLYGYQKHMLLSACCSIGSNVFFSVLLAKLLPAEYAIAGLGIGTCLGGLAACTNSLLAIRRKKIPLNLTFSGLKLSDAFILGKRGLSTSGNNLADGMVSGIINNIILRGFGGDATALSVYTAVKAIVVLGTSTVMSATLAVAPLFGILYGSRDKNGLVRTLKEGFKVGLFFSVLWCGLLIVMLPVLANSYGMQDNSVFRSGVIFCMMFMPLILLVRLMTQLFESTEKTGMGLLYASIPDSVIYPILLALLLPSLQYTGIWIAYSANTIPFLLVLYLVRSFKNKSFRFSLDRMLCLDESIRDNVPLLDISIRSNNTDVTGISSQVSSFLASENVSDRTAYMTALCLEELASDFVAHVEESDLKADRIIMDIKLFSDEDALRIVIRNAAKPYNPLDFQLDQATFAKVGVKMAQKVSRRIDYSYVYKLNIITILLDK